MEPPIIIMSDDDPLVVNAFSRQATRAGMWVVPDTASRVSELASVVEPAVIVLDINQAVHGLELLRELKANPVTKDFPVIICTSHGTAELREEALRLGAEAFELKPVDTQFILGLARRAGQVWRERIAARTAV